MTSTLPPMLQSLLCASLPQGAKLTFHYLSSTPAECDPLFASPPNEPPQRTEWESHLLSVSIDHEDSLVQVLAIEALIYDTSSLTTVFVSKADSSGYLHLANLPKTSKSTIRCIASAFLEYLVSWKRSSSRRLVLSLFARSQAQYLFPGSAENTHKHVLDDRQLIRWWSRILDDVLVKFEDSDKKQVTDTSETQRGKSMHGYVVVPGLDPHEARTYIPRGSTRWSTSSPLRQLSPYPDGPERCLIPRFPDDPKARFALDLDGELPENAIQPSDATEAPEPSKTGKWRSVRSLEQFWELMAFRQECAAGRVVGFLWAVFEPVGGPPGDKPDAPSTQQGTVTTNGTSQEHKAPATDETATTSESQSAPAATDAAPSAEAGASTSADPAPDASTPTTPATALRVGSAGYATITSLLEQLDYADLALAKTSTQRFLEHAAKTAAVSGGTWGLVLAGTRALDDLPPSDAQIKKADGAPTMLIGRKRKKEKVEDPPAIVVTEAPGELEAEGTVKRAKTEETEGQVA